MTSTEHNNNDSHPYVPFNEDEDSKTLAKEYEKREYQIYLLQQAIKQNVIICLPTGSGKTFIAAHAAKHFLVQAAENGQKIIFVATTVPLAHQQAKYLERHVGTKVLTVTGELKPQDWNGSKWKQILSNAIVYSMTVQVLADAICHTFIKWADISVLLLDECHNAVGNHAMSTLMESYRRMTSSKFTKSTTLPRIIGLSATIVIGSPKSPKEVSDGIRIAEEKFCAKAMTYHDYMEVMKCSTSATIRHVHYRTKSAWPKNLKLFNKDMTTLIKKIRLNIRTMDDLLFQNGRKLPNVRHPTLRHKGQYFNRGETFAETLIKHVRAVGEILIEMGPYCAVNAALMKLALARYLEVNEILIRKNPNKPTPKEILCRYVKMQMGFVARKLRNYISAYNISDKEKVLLFVTPKVRQLVKILKQYNGLGSKEPNPNDICGIVFCKTRIVTQMLNYYLQDLCRFCPEEFGFLKSSFVVGNAGQQNEIVLKAALKKQETVLTEFREKTLNLLVATSVLEEGLDVPSCNLICRFDNVETFPSYIQSMGRARMKGAKFYALISKKDSASVTKKLSKFSNLKTTLNEALVNNVAISEKFYIDEGDDFGELELNKLIPPFQPEPNGALLTAGNATQIAYQYCNGLSCDKLTTLSPIAWSVKELRAGVKGVPIGMHKVFVQLPPGSCVTLVEGGWFSDRNVAKKAAFLEICKQLYAKGALYDKTLLPIPPHVLLNMDEFIEGLEGSVEKYRKGKKIGCKNAIEWYSKKIPNSFLKVLPPSKYNIYSLAFTTMAYFGHDENEGLFKFEDNHLQFGIVTEADLTTVPDFILFSRDGNFRVSLKQISVSNACLDLHRTISELKCFQDSIFYKDSMLLRLDNSVLGTETENRFYIAPLRKTDTDTFEIAFDIIHNLRKSQDTDYFAMKSVQERQETIFTSAQLTNALVVPSVYPQNSRPQSYCVVSLRHDLSPLSTLEVKKNGVTETVDFLHYYKTTYGIDIIHQDGPLIRGKAISDNMHYLKSPFYEDAAKKLAEKANLSSTLSLIPEFVRIHPLPANMYIQLKMLPSCIHRIERLLLANEILDLVAPSFPSKNMTNGLKRNSDTELLRLNAEIVKIVTNPTPIIGVIPKHSPVTGPLSQLSQPSSGPRKRKLWVEMEYIHPKNMKLEDLQGPDLNFENKMEYGSKNVVHSQETGLIPMSQVPHQHFDHQPIPEQPPVFAIMEAITLANGRDYMSYEKLEMIGDSVLKLIVTLHIYFQFPDDGEGRLTALRTQLISNRHLFHTAAMKNQLGEYLAGSLFQPKHCWTPPGKSIRPDVTKAVVDNGATYAIFDQLENGKGEFKPPIDVSSIDFSEINTLVQERLKKSEFHSVSGAPGHTTYTHSRLGDKNLADSVEALIGAYYMSGGIKGALKFMDGIGLRGPTNDKPAKQVMYQEINKLPKVKSNYPTGTQTAILSTLVHQLEKQIGYKFKNQWLVVEAFTHPSAVVSCGSSYQRLEFLGDAILDFLVTHYIYQNKKMQTPGKLTDLRSALVNNVTFGTQTVRYGFHQLLRHFSQSLQTAIDTFENCQRKNGHKVTETFELLSDNESRIAKDIEVPKALGDLMESLAGAVFIDSGRSLDTTWSVFYRLMKPEIDLFSDNIPLQPIRQLYERFPDKVTITTISKKEERKVVEISIPGRHGSYFGCGNTKKSAKEAAAKYAVKQLRNNT